MANIVLQDFVWFIKKKGIIVCEKWMTKDVWQTIKWCQEMFDISTKEQICLE